MFKSGFENPTNYLGCYQELIGREITKKERIPLINDFNACEKAWYIAQTKKRIE